MSDVRDYVREIQRSYDQDTLLALGQRLSRIYDLVMYAQEASPYTINDLPPDHAKFADTLDMSIVKAMLAVMEAVNGR